MKYIFIFLLLVSCTNKTTVLNTTVFDVGYKSTTRFTGNFYDEKSKKEIIYFAEPVTNKKIKFFEVDGTFVKEISLVNIANEMETIDNVFISNLDSIHLFSLKKNQIQTIDSNNQKIRTIDLSKITYLNGDIYEFRIYGSARNIIWHNKIFLATQWFDNINKKVDPEKNELVDFYDNWFNSDNLISIEIDKEGKLQKNVVINSFYKNISKSADVFMEGNYYTFIKNKLLYTSLYSDKLYVFDPNNGKLITTKPIFSDFTKITNGGIPLNKTTLPDLQNLINLKMKKSYISSIFYNTNSNNYEIILQHEINQSESFSDRKFSILIYNNNFKKLEEIYFKDQKYNSFSALFIDNKIMLECKNESKTSKKYETIEI